ncbi:MAG: hypothetical protein WCT26_02065 [Candidatus Buchananbacteria bacterium]|jgi:hypothetical protein
MKKNKLIAYLILFVVFIVPLLLIIVLAYYFRDDIKYSFTKPTAIYSIPYVNSGYYTKDIIIPTNIIDTNNNYTLTFSIPFKNLSLKNNWDLIISKDDKNLYENKFNILDNKSLFYKIVDLFLNQYGPYNDQQVFVKVLDYNFSSLIEGTYNFKIFTDSKIENYNDTIILNIFKN